MTKGLNITAQETHLILFAFDNFFNTDERGKVNPNVSGFSPSRAGLLKCLGIDQNYVQTLRDKLFGAHDHFEAEE